MGHAKIRTRRPVEVRFPPAGIFALESRHARGFAMPPTQHDYLKVLLVYSGAGAIHGSGGLFSLVRGDVVVVPPGCEHWVEDRRPLSLYALCFRKSEFSDGWPKLICESGKLWVVYRKGAELLGLARRILHEQLDGSPGSVAMARGLAWQMLALVTRFPRGAVSRSRSVTDPTGSRSRVVEAAKGLRHRFYEPMRIEEAAGRAGLGRRRFTQLFREVTGRTWWEALNAARLDHAERLLCETDRSVVSVAFECGYGDLSGFYRAWSARHETSPQVWRQR